MISRLLDSLPELLRVHTRLTLFVLLCVGSALWYSINTFASKDEVKTVQSQLAALATTLDRTHQEQRIHNIESEIFSLDRITSSGTARSDDFDRLSKLRSELGSAQRELRRIDQKSFNH
jgi:uncharacterized protein (DUF3084 family)